MPFASASDLSTEVVDHILHLYLARYPKKRGKITVLSRLFRERFRCPLTVELYGSRPFFETSTPSRGQVVVLRNQLAKFFDDLTSFGTVFSGPHNTLTFGEIQNVKINLPFDNDALVKRLRLAARSLTRVKQVKFSAWADEIDLEDFMRTIGRLSSGFAGTTVLSLHLSTWDLTPLPPYSAWHRPFFLRNLAPYSSVTCLKLRTSLPMFPNPPVDSDDSDTALEQASTTCLEIASTRARMEKIWSQALMEKLPALTEIHLAESQDESLGVEGWHYTGTRNVWYRSAEGWDRTEWRWPGERIIPGDWWRRFRRTTRKANFDAWGSDGEYPELDESGW